MDIRSALGDLSLLETETLGDSQVCIAVLDGPVYLSDQWTSHTPCFEGANLRRLVTLVPDPVVAELMSLHGTHIASLTLGQPDSPVVGIAPARVKARNY